MTKVGDVFKIGQICPISGIYRLQNCALASKKQHKIPLTKGEKFPPCRNCKEEISWEFVRSA